MLEIRIFSLMPAKSSGRQPSLHHRVAMSFRSFVYVARYSFNLFVNVLPLTLKDQ